MFQIRRDVDLGSIIEAASGLFAVVLSTGFGLLALTVSLISILLQYVPEPKIVALPPEQILIVAYDYSGTDEAIPPARVRPFTNGTNSSYEFIFTRFAARMTYFNRRRFGSAALLLRERLIIEFNNGRYLQKWQSFRVFDAKGDMLVTLTAEGATPQAILPGAAESHETFFAPTSPRTNFISWKSFNENLGQERRLDFRFQADFIDHPTLRTECTVDVTDELRDVLSERGWASPGCRPVGGAPGETIDGTDLTAQLVSLMVRRLIRLFVAQ